MESAFAYNIWTSTTLGNKRLDAAMAECGSVFLFFLVNESGKFCGVCQMKGPVNFTESANVWLNSKFKGFFPIEWHYIKDVPHRVFHHLKVVTNNGKPITNSRDTQEIPFAIAVAFLEIFAKFGTN